MASLNRIQIIGNLGKDPEMKFTAAGAAVASFSVAATEKFNNTTHTEWFRVKAFGKLAEICGEYLRKGKQVYIEGKIQTDEWTDKDGQKRTTIEVIARDMVMLGGGEGKQDRPAEKQTAAERYGQYDPTAPTPEGDDSIPF